MSYRFECDRCHRLFTSEYGLLVVHTKKDEKEGWIRHFEDVKHYCPFCNTLYGNAVSLVDSGVYGGNLSPEAKIGKQLPMRERFDPLINPKAQKDNLDENCDVLEREDDAD